MLLSSYEATDTTFLSVIAYPWRQFIVNGPVRRRIEGFRFLRGNLKIRVTITGNPMLGGRFIVAYHPRQRLDPYPACGQLSECRTMQLCMLPHIFLDPTTGTGGEMTLPFFSPDNWIDLTETFSAENMGALVVHTVNNVFSANGTTAAAHIRVYAWMENAEICTPTSVGFFSWTEQSEFAMSPVSKTATAIARVASIASDVPMFRPYAKATEMVATSIGKIATMFGFSRPAILDNMIKSRMFFAGELASATSHEAVMRLGYDNKGELTIDPRTVGLPPVDEMTIHSIAQRECYFDTLQWSASNLVNSFMYRINVSPIQFETDSTVTPFRSVLTPTAAAALPFTFWRGTLTYRIQIVASAFHRGKLRLVYSPNGISGTLGFNDVYSRIIDLETDRDVEFSVSWNSLNSFLRIVPPAIGTTSFEKGVDPVYNPIYHNGQLGLQVLTPLVAPDPALGGSIAINFFIRANDDFEVAVPSENMVNMRFISPTESVLPQSGTLEQDRSQDNSPVGGEAHPDIGNSFAPREDHTTKVFFGESIRSFRTFLRRYQAVTLDPITTPVNMPIRAPMTSTSNIEYVLSMYAGWRGSLRYKIIMNPGTVTNYSNSHLICGLRSRTSLAATSGSGMRATTRLGAAANVACVEFELPYYSNKRFSPARWNPNFTNPVDRTSVDDFQKDRIAGYHLASADVPITVFRSVGEDFTTFFFLGLPPLYAL